MCNGRTVVRNRTVSNLQYIVHCTEFSYAQRLACCESDLQRSASPQATSSVAGGELG